MEEMKPKFQTEKLYIPPKILASYSKEELEEIMERSGLHATNGCGCGTGLNQERYDGLNGLPPP